MKFLLPTILLLSLAARIVCAGDLPARIDIEYALKGSIGKGKAYETFLIQNENGSPHYTIDSQISASGFLSLIKPGNILRHSQGTVNQHGLQPSNFTDQRGDKPARVVEFDWDKQRIVYRRKGREMVAALPAGTLDELSLPYHFMFAPPPSQTLTIHETDYRNLRTTHYTVSQEMLDTPIGTLATIVLTKQQEQNDPFKKKIWLATDHHLLPVRIVATEKNGLEVDQTVKKINYVHDDGPAQ
jgi:hypothetical protein